MSLTPTTLTNEDGTGSQTAESPAIAGLSLASREIRTPMVQTDHKAPNRAGGLPDPSECRRYAPLVRAAGGPGPRDWALVVTVLSRDAKLAHAPPSRENLPGRSSSTRRSELGGLARGIRPAMLTSRRAGRRAPGAGRVRQCPWTSGRYRPPSSCGGGGRLPRLRRGACERREVRTRIPRQMDARHDRVEGVGAQLTVEGLPGWGTRLLAEIPSD